MSKTLNMVDCLLSKGRTHQQLGRTYDALHILDRLNRLHDLPADVCEEVKSRLAEMLLDDGRFVKARRHLTALLVQCPDSAHYHMLMARALERDDRADPQRAAEHYRRALELDPELPGCRSEYGLLLLRLAPSEEGLALLRAAVEEAPHDPMAAQRLAEGLWQEGLDDEAVTALRCARFRNPRDARFLKLWNDFQFRMLHAKAFQGSASVEVENRPYVIPFVRPASSENVGDKVVRHDPPSVPQPPHLPQPRRVPDKRQA